MGELRTYRRKRDFSRTDEPEGGRGRRPTPEGGRRGPGGMYCIQKHAASRLHFDLRLELDGVLVSWAVPKGPSYDPATKRLAMHVEDHPVEYGDFEGTIPKGEYGGGTVMLWDTGTWEPIDDAHAGLEKGEFKFRIHGERLRGGWVLIHTGGRRGMPENQWLLIKERDEHVRRGEPDPWGPDDRSVLTGRTMEEIAAGRQPRRTAGGAGARSRAADDDADGSDGSRRSATTLPSSVPLQLATLVEDPPRGDEWLHEIKYDGYRIAARIDDGKVRLFSRNELDWTGRFEEVAGALEDLPTAGTWLDGEVVVLDDRGVSDFGRLQRYVKEGEPGDLTYVAFDLLFQDGEDLRGLPLKERKRRLHWLLERGGPVLRTVVQYGDHIEGRGEAVFEEACLQGLEGIVSKRAGDAYAGRRTRSWLKVKCRRRQEFVIGGFTEPSGARSGFGALLLGVYDGQGALRYAGRVGSGFGDRALAELYGRLGRLERATAPFTDPPRGAQARGVHWTSPKLVAEVAFTEWTSDDQLRHPVFKGLREDKAPKDVVREGAGRPGQETGRESAAGAGTKPPPPADDDRAGGAGGATDAGAGGATDAGAARASGRTSRAPSPARGAKASRPVVGGVGISHPDRVVFPDPGTTKLGVAEYYDAVAALMVPYLEQRALTVIRCPDGIATECFFQKHVTPSVPKAVSKARVRGADGQTDVYPVVDTAEGLVAMVQNGAVEFHVWGSRVSAIEVPDMLVFDLDPGPDVPWRRVREAARTLRDELRDRGLESYLRTSGGKGLHVVAPYTSRARWPRVGAFARDVVETLAAREPARYTATMSKAKRSGKVFIDHFRNGRGATSVASYSLRARPGAPVAMPIEWDELGRTKGGNDWTLERVLRRLRTRTTDPWEDFFETGRRQKLPDEGR